MVLYYELIDMEGRVVRKKNVGKSAEGLSLRMDLHSGVYLLRLIYESSTETLRIVKK